MPPVARSTRTRNDRRTAAPSASADALGDALADPLGGDAGPLQLKEGGPSSAGSASAGGLPDGLRSGIEALSGVDMSGVKVERGSSEPSRLGALAYAKGDTIHMAPGQESLLPHEAWHVAQQRQGRVTGDTQLAGGATANTDGGLEREADVMGARAAELGGAAAPEAVEAGTGSRGVVQRVLDPSYAAANDLALKVRALLNSGATTVPDKLQSEADKLKGSSIKPIKDLATVIAGGNASILTNPGRKAGVLGQAGRIIETVAKDKAEGLETAEGGHSLGRHGPEISDKGLKDRLSTGVAADGAFSPTPGASTRFSSYEAYLETREEVSKSLKSAMKATRNHLKGDLRAYQTAKKAYDKEPPGIAKAPNQPLALAVNQAKTDIQNKVDGIGADHATMAPVKFRPAAPDPQNWIVGYQGYKVGLDHGKGVGTGFKGKAGTEAVVNDPSGSGKSGQGWTDNESMGDITKTFSAIDAPANDLPIFPDLDPSAWTFGQHFPSDTALGFRI